jgi:predicted dehydrogenase
MGTTDGTGSDDRMTRIGVCGTAFWAENVHLPGWKANPDAELAGVWGRTSARTRELAEAYGILAFSDFDELVEAVDAISFVVPPDVQGELATRAARAGRHVLLEKPIAAGLGPAEALVAAIGESGVAALCFLTRLYVPEVARFLAEAKLQEPLSGTASFRSNALLAGPYAGSSWRKSEHGALWDAAPHALSVLASVLGPIAEVTAVVTSDGGYDLSLRHAGGATSRLDLSLRDPGVKLAERYRFAGRQSEVDLPELAYDRQQTFTHASRVFIRSIRGERREDETHLGLGLHLVAVATAAETSLATESRPVGVPKTSRDAALPRSGAGAGI